MKIQRIELMNELRKNITQDEITKKLIKSNSQNHNVFSFVLLNLFFKLIRIFYLGFISRRTKKARYSM